MAVEEAAVTDISIKELLTELIKLGGSDLHIVVGLPPIARVNGRCEPMHGYPSLSSDASQEIIYTVMNEEDRLVETVEKVVGIIETEAARVPPRRVVIR